METDLEKGQPAKTSTASPQDSIKSPRAAAIQAAERRRVSSGSHYTISPSSNSGANVHREILSGPSELVAEYNALLAIKRATLPWADKLHLESARTILRSLYSLNLSHARAILYKDYMTLASKDYGLGSEDWENLEQHVHQHSQATNDYLAFRGPLTDRQSETHLVEVAVRLAAIEEYEQRQAQKLEKTESNQTVIAEARKELSLYYQNHVLDQGIIHSFRRINPDDVVEKTAVEKAQIDKEKAQVKREKKRFWSNLKMAVFGGSALIVPMLIMTLHQTKLTSLLTTSLFVLAVAAILAVVMKTAEPKDIVGATAGYAAVLVVFIGTGAGPDRPVPETLPMVGMAAG